jgi:hypothetical protein
MTEPGLPASARKTYQILSPAETHTRKVTCTEADCPYQANGWRSVIDESTELGIRQASYIRHQSGRQFTVLAEGGLTVFVFEAGQTCFQEHRASLDRPAHYIVRDGDHRGNPLGTAPRVHANSDDWVDDFATHQQGLADRLQQG